MSGVERRVVYFRKLLFKSNDEKFSLRRVKSKRFADIQEEICFRAVWRWAILESKLRGWNEKKSSA